MDQISINLVCSYLIKLYIERKTLIVVFVIESNSFVLMSAMELEFERIVTLRFFCYSATIAIELSSNS